VKAATIVVVVLVLLGLWSSVYVVPETEQVIITQFGEPVRGPITDAGLHFKIPFIWKVNRFDKRWLEWDGDANQIPTLDKKYIWVDTYARWRIADPLLFFQRVRDERGAQSRLDDVIDGATRNAVASHDLIEVVRSSSRPFEVTAELKGITPGEEAVKIKVGREKIAQEILEKASKITPEYGIELVDVRFKRIDYIESVRRKVYERMISERKRIAARYRSEGQGKSAEIRGQMERKLREIRSEAYRKAEEIRGKADAEATKIYAEAYNKDPEFYAFLKTLETWEKALGPDASLILSTDSDVFRYLKRAK